MPLIHEQPEEFVQAQYEKQRNLRIRSDVDQQFIDVNKSDSFSYINNDTWVDHEALNKVKPAIQDKERHKFLILGTGYGGLLFAVRLLEAGYSANDIRFVDTAGGFGGTWYWNRYPGLMCNVESYVYMPLLEETGYMPRNKYFYGSELLEHANRVAQQFNLADKALLRSRITSAEWDEDSREWVINIKEFCGPKDGLRDLKIRSSFLLLSGGILKIPHIPKITGIDKLEIPHFHSARWDYSITGGTPEEQKLEKLKGKRVGIIGTGLTAIQIIPQLAKWAEHLTVFQRTPTSCGFRGQRETDPEDWKKITGEKGWRKKRAENFNSLVRGEPVDVDLVHDGWCETPSFSAVIGSTRKSVIEEQKVADHIAELNSLDFPRAQMLRERVDSIVHDKSTAKKLKAWYPTYCKRPTFHDDYLQSFNEPNVQLVETPGHGVEAATERGVIVDGVEYPVDILVFSTGFRTAGTKASSPAANSDVTVTGRNGTDLDEKWSSEGPMSLHGCCTNGFPNLFFTGTAQTGVACNISYVLDNHAKHIAHCVKAAIGADRNSKATIEPSLKAERTWANESARLAGWFATLPTCTPGHFNGYSSSHDPKNSLKLSRAAPWGLGSQDFVERLERWRAAGDLSDFIIQN